MLNKVKQIIYNPFVCYSPAIILLIVLLFHLFQFSSNECLLDAAALECLTPQYSTHLIYFLLKTTVLIFLFYTCFYLYYTIIVGDNLVAKAVEITHKKIKKKFRISNEYKDFLIFIFCYLASLIFSYFFVFILVFKKRF
jgi:hypothetical protein